MTTTLTSTFFSLLLLIATPGLAQPTNQPALQPAPESSQEPWIERVEPPFYFAVQVEDMERSIHWYRSVLGLRLLDRSEAEDKAWQIVNLANETLWLELIRDQRATQVKRARGFFKVGFRVPNVDRVADRIENAGLDRPRVVDFEAHGLRILQLEDPDGNRLQLSSKIPTP